MNIVSFRKKDVNEMKVNFGGGSFWYTEAVFQRIKGVLKVENGYSGGIVVNPTYGDVCRGKTGHAEVVEVTYNPEEISFADLLEIHLNTHNPTTTDRRSVDNLSQYRSIIFYRTEIEKKIAVGILVKIQKLFAEVVVTQLQMFEAFYKAEEYHQDYYNRNGHAGYCRVVIHPKLSKFIDLYHEKLKQ